MTWTWSPILQPCLISPFVHPIGQRVKLLSVLKDRLKHRLVKCVQGHKPKLQHHLLSHQGAPWAQWCSASFNSLLILCVFPWSSVCLCSHYIHGGLAVVTEWILNESTLKVFNKPWLVWLSGLSTCLWTKGSPVRFPVRAHAWVVGQVPSWERMHKRQPHIDVSIPLFVLPFPSL